MPDKKKNITIRPAVAEDCERIAEIHHAAFASGIDGNYQEWYAHYSKEHLSQNVDISAGWKRAFETPDDRIKIFVAENADGQIVGVAKMATDAAITLRQEKRGRPVSYGLDMEKTGMFFGRFIDPEHHGKGVGSALRKKQIETFLEAGKTHAFVQIYANHSRQDGQSQWHNSWLKLGAKPVWQDVCVVKGYLPNEMKRAMDDSKTPEERSQSLPHFVRTVYFQVDLEKALRILNHQEASADLSIYADFHEANEPDQAATNYASLLEAAQAAYINTGQLSDCRL